MNWSNAGRLPGGARMVLLVAVLGAVGLMSLRGFSRQFIYLPWRWSAEEARRWNPGYEEIWIPVDEGVSLHGWLYRGTHPDLAVLVCHGNAGHLGVQEGLLEPYRRLGVTALLFDYRGYGLSTGSPDEEGIAADALAAFDRLSDLTALPAHRIIVHGKSLGGAPAARTAIARRPAGLILESAFTSALELGRYHYPFLPVSWLLQDRLDTVGRLPEVRAPILILHGERDRIVPPVHAERLARAAGDHARRIMLPQADHNNTYRADSQKYLEELGRFLDQALAGGGTAGSGPDL